MGIRSGVSVTFNIENVNGLNDLKNICNAVKKTPDSTTNVNRNNQCIHVDVDCNWIANRDTIKNVHEVADFLESLSINGFIVTPVCDGEFRHHSKRATVERCADRQKSRHQATECRLKISKLKQTMAKCSHQSDESNQEMKQLDKCLKKYENNASPGISGSFGRELSEIVQKRNDDRLFYDPLQNTSGVSVNNVLIAEFQADAVLAKRAIEGYSDLIIANDGDFLALVGQPCLLMKGFKFDRKAGKKQERREIYIDNQNITCVCIKENTGYNSYYFE